MQLKTNKDVLIKVDKEMQHLKRLLKIKTETLDVRPYGRRNSYFEKCLTDEIIEINKIVCGLLDIKINILDRLITEGITLNAEADDIEVVENITYKSYLLTTKIRQK